MTARMRRHEPVSRGRVRVSGAAGNATVLPLLVIVAALAAAAIMLATVVAHTSGGSAPAWSGDQGPPGAVGLTPEHIVLRADAGGH
jgi:hypothetical protein